MVFRGKPSRACQRCRARRLKCDLQQPECSPCVRAGSICCGWRDIHRLRVYDESWSVVRRATRTMNPPSPKPLQVGIGSRARDAFYLHYVSNPMSRCWTFLEPYYPASASCPAYLALAIDALSLVHLWHEVNSEAALVAARQCYILALRETRKVLRCPPEQTPQAVVLAALVLDLVEKIISASRHALSSHIDGALSMVSSIGFSRFQSPDYFPILVRLSNHALFGCLVAGAYVPTPVLVLRSVVEQRLNATDYPKGMDTPFVQYIDLLHDFRSGTISEEVYGQTCYDLDVQLGLADLSMPISWRYTIVERQAGANELFSQCCHIYKHRNFAQARNLIRVFRLLLNEAIIDYAPHLQASQCNEHVVAAAHANIQDLVMHIWASVPQYADCGRIAGRLLPATKRSTVTGLGHDHSPQHVKDCYTLLFPLYAAARSRVSPHVRGSIVKQLHYMAEHFCIRNAKHVAHLLEQDTPPRVWDVYTQLGSYAFMA